MSIAWVCNVFVIFLFSALVRFRMQVMLNGKLFPIAEASSKKVAKKDAAAAALRILIGKIQGGPGPLEEGNAAVVDQMLDILPETSVRFFCFDKIISCI